MGRRLNDQAIAARAQARLAARRERRASLRLSQRQRDTGVQALAALEEHLLEAAKIWPELTPVQRGRLRAHSPVLDRFLQLSERFRT